MGVRGHGNTCVDRAAVITFDEIGATVVYVSVCWNCWTNSRSARTANATGSRLLPPSWSFSG